MAFLESRKQRATELVVTNSPTRVDGLPSLTRLFRANGKGDFKERTRVPVATRKGARFTRLAPRLSIARFAPSTDTEGAPPCS